MYVRSIYLNFRLFSNLAPSFLGIENFFSDPFFPESALAARPALLRVGALSERVSEWIVIHRFFSLFILPGVIEPKSLFRGRKLLFRRFLS